MPVIARKSTLGYRTSQFIRRNRAYVLTSVASVLVLLIMIAAARFLPGSHPTTQAGLIRSVAVLPLENLSHDPEQEYFADGMTEALITDLAQIGALQVTSRTSVMSYKGTRRPLPEIARALKVEAVIEGSVQRAGSRVRIAVQLIQAATDRHLWAKSYEGDLSDVLTLQSTVAQAIAQEIKVQLTPQERTRLAGVRPVSQAAYDAYLKGRYFWNVVTTEEATRKSIDYYEQAIAKDPDYALAYAGLAYSYLRLNTYRIKPPGEFLPKAQMAAMKAVALDDTLAEAHTALGQVKVAYEWDWSGAEREFQRAIALNPRYGQGHAWYGHFLMAMGRPATAVKELKRAQESDPLSLAVNLGLAGTLSSAGQYEQAIEQARQVLEMDPSQWIVHRGLGRIYERKGMYEEALLEFQKAVDLSGAPWAQADIAYTYAVSGQRGKAERRLRELLERSKHRYVAPYHIGEVHAGLGEKDQAFQWLNKAFEEHSDELRFLNANPRLTSLHPDPRFAVLLRRVGLPP
ncbi:MAG: tetratricopeptide repeat protein [Acidobacteria bacterium]|nr:tetratricopeptide repeat protein [Acidobacteriota bacterium]